MTQAEQALDGQEPDRMAEALRSILQGANEVHSRHGHRPSAALPRPTLAGVPAKPAAPAG